MSVKLLNIHLRIEAACDAGLIGDDEDKQPGVVERLDRGFGAVDPAEPGDRTDIAVIMVEYPVAVEKGCRPTLVARDFKPGPGKVIRHADIDKVSVISGA